MGSAGFHVFEIEMLEASNGFVFVSPVRCLICGVQRDQLHRIATAWAEGKIPHIFAHASIPGKAPPKNLFSASALTGKSGISSCIFLKRFTMCSRRSDNPVVRQCRKRTVIATLSECTQHHVQIEI